MRTGERSPLLLVDVGKPVVIFELHAALKPRLVVVVVVVVQPTPAASLHFNNTGGME